MKLKELIAMLEKQENKEIDVKVWLELKSGSLTSASFSKKNSYTNDKKDVMYIFVE